jgi:hypothetical protein
MSSIGHNTRKKFIESRIHEAFGERDMTVDQMIDDLATEGRTTSVF